MDDLIRRQDAIDAVGNMLRRKFGIGGELAEITINDLPSAQSEHLVKESGDLVKDLVNDCISRQAAIGIFTQLWDCIGTIMDRDEWEDICRTTANELPSAQPEPRWIPVKTRPMDEEERKYYLEELGWSLDDNEAVMFDSLMPGDGQEVWVCSKCGNVWQDTCVIDEGIGLEENGDWLDIVAWMPFERPEPWKGEEDECMDA